MFDVSTIPADLPTPSLLIDGPTVDRNIRRMADYARAHDIALRPHTKTHKSQMIARRQMNAGAIGLTVAKVGEAGVMSQVSDDVLIAYPIVDRLRAARVAELTQTATMRVAVDSTPAVDALSAAAESAGSTIGLLIELDTGFERTGMQRPDDVVSLARHISRSAGVSFNGVMFFPGQMFHLDDAGAQQMQEIVDRTRSVLDQLQATGFPVPIVSGGSTPTARWAHQFQVLTEMRPGTYGYNDRNELLCEAATIDDCAARMLCTVVSRPAEDRCIIDAGSKALTSDACAGEPSRGYGHIVEYPQSKVAWLNEEHGVVHRDESDTLPEIGERVTVIPNHICPCVNLQDRFWWHDENGDWSEHPVDARGMTF